MNALSFPFPRVPVASNAASMVYADAHIGAAMDRLSEATAGLFGPRAALTDRERTVEAHMRAALVALAKARNLIGPLTVEKAS